MTTIAKVGSEFLVNTQTASDQIQPNVTGLANGGFVVTWTDLSGTLGDSSSYSIKAQVFDAGGAKVGTEFLVNTQTAGYQVEPTVTGLTNGGFVVTWADASHTLGDSSGSYSIKAQVFSAGGAKVGSEFLVNTQTASDQVSPTITGLTNGGFVVTWADASHTLGDSSGSYSIKAQVFSAGGAKVGSEFLVNTQTADDQEWPSVTGLVNGGFVVTWNDFSGTLGDSDGWSIKAQVFDAGGAKVGTEFLVNTQTAGYQIVPTVTGLTNGGFVVTWEDYSGTLGDSDNTSIKAQVFDAGGAKVGSEFLVNTQTAIGQAVPTITGLANGGFVVTWSDGSQTLGDSSQASIKAQVFNAGGAKVGSEFLVNTQTGDDQEYSDVIGLVNGGFVVTWRDSSGTLGDSSGTSIKAQVFSVVSPNVSPVGVNDTGSATEAGGVNNGTPGSNATGNVLSNDTDVDNTNASLLVSAIRTGAVEGFGTAGTLGAGLTGAHGTLTLNANGSYTYVINENDSTVQALNSGQTLTDSFNYTVKDPGNLTDTAVLTITINGANDTPAQSGFDFPLGQPDQTGHRLVKTPQLDADGYHLGNFGRDATSTDPDTDGFDPDAFIEGDLGDYEPNSGVPIDPLRTRNYHLGEDWNRDDGADWNKPVFSIAEGTIREVYLDDPDGIHGWKGVVIIEHPLPTGGSVFALYGHLTLSSISSLVVNSPIHRGDPVGRIDQVSDKEGPHLHFEIRTADNDLNNKHGFDAVGNGYYAGLPPNTWLDPTDFIASQQGTSIPHRPIVNASIQGDLQQTFVGSADQPILTIQANANLAFNWVLGAQGENVLVSRSDTGKVLLKASQFLELLFNGGAGIDILTILSLIGTAVTKHTVFFNGMDGDDRLDGSSTDRRLVASGGNDNDVLIGGSEDDLLSGDAGNDTLTGGAGNDTLVGDIGNDSLNGGTGIDSAIYSGNRASYTITRSGMTTTVSGPDGTDTLTSLEMLQFADGTVVNATVQISNQTTHVQTVSEDTPYSGPVKGLDYQYIDLSKDNLNVTGLIPNGFIHTGSGFDAIDVSNVSGTNVLDGGTNSNFLVGGTAAGSFDTFFVDNRNPPGDIWSTVVNFHKGDDATVWGVTQAGFNLAFANGEGAAGFTGLTLHVTKAGVPTASLTLAGYSTADLTNGKLSTSFGSVGGSDYFFVHGNA